MTSRTSGNQWKLFSLSQLMRKSVDSDGSRTSAVVEGDDDVEDVVMSLTIEGES